VTQRGNRRGRVFFSDADHLAYLHWLREYGLKHELETLAYCLMTNHVHLVLVPGKQHSLAQTLQYVHMRYAQRVNRAKGWGGHVWQARYFSSALDEPHLWAAIRYAECNPVRAGMVGRAEDYPWSSARAHCGLARDPVLSTRQPWLRQLEGIGNWSDWLSAGDERQCLEELRRNTAQNLPCGSEDFIAKLQADCQRNLRRRQRGRPRLEGKGI